MRRCDTCGHDYDKTFEVARDDRVYTFHSLECAAVALAPKCTYCGCRVLGHGPVARTSDIACYACAASARRAG